MDRLGGDFLGMQTPTVRDLTDDGQPDLLMASRSTTTIPYIRWVKHFPKSRYCPVSNRRRYRSNLGEVLGTDLFQWGWSS